jgi:hypothetical protein
VGEVAAVSDPADLHLDTGCGQCPQERPGLSLGALQSDLQHGLTVEAQNVSSQVEFSQLNRTLIHGKLYDYPPTE